MAKRNEVLTELQMLTGISSKDVTVLYYHLVKGGTYFTDISKQEIKEDELTMESFDEWFNKLEDVE